MDIFTTVFLVNLFAFIAVCLFDHFIFDDIIEDTIPKLFDSWRTATFLSFLFWIVCLVAVELGA